MPIKFEAEDRSLSHILCGDEKYKIPRYQRPYSWTEDQVSDLWNDLKTNDASFLGTFVFNYEFADRDKVVEVIDGQQRLITLTILMAAIRDLYRELGDSKKAELTQDKIIEFKHPITGEPTYRLKCGDTLENFFQENIQKDSANLLSLSPKRKEEKLIKGNYIFLKNQISSELSQYADKSKKIDQLDNLKQRAFDLKIIWVRIDKDEDAYSIFETVNARGADLTAADLLKNHLFQKIPRSQEGVDTAKKQWETIENNVESAKGPLNVSKFIRYYWLSRYAFVPEKRLYKEIKSTISDPQLFLHELEKASEYYYKIASSSVSLDDWNEEFPEDKKAALRTYEALEGLRAIEITQCYSLILCLLMNKERIGFDFTGIFKVIENYHFAYSAICKLSGNVVERVYYRAAESIQRALKTENEKKRRGEVEKVLADFKNELDYPSRELFAEKFKDVEYKNYPLVIYILSNIEKVRGTTEETLLNPTKINIEHILPQEPSEWNLSKKDVKDYVNNLGNLTLIAKKINGPMGNKPLKEKVKLFRNSKLNINVELVKKFEELRYKWGEKEIADRQRELADFAYDFVWKF